MVPRTGVETNYFRWGQLECLRVLAVFRDYIEYSQYFEVHILRTLPILHSRRGSAGTACTRGPVLLMLPVLAVFGPSVLLILAVLGSILAANTTMLSVFGARNTLDTPKYTRSMVYTWASVIFIYIFSLVIVCFLWPFLYIRTSVLSSNIYLKHATAQRNQPCTKERQVRVDQSATTQVGRSSW